MITTKDRRDELREAVRSAVAQSIALEVIVIDDGSTDGTSEMILAEFPSVRLERSETSFGYIVQRNRGALLARGDIIFSIDDDAVFASTHTVEQTLAEFNNPRIGAVAIPYIEPHKSNSVYQKAPSKEDIFVTDDFIGTAHALRKDVFLKLGGYRESLVHQGEEMDFCIRMLDAGYVVRLGDADVIHHMESPRRNFSRMDFYGRRNDILFAWHNVPMLWLSVHLAATTYLGLRHAIHMRRLFSHLNGMTSGWGAVLKGREERKTVNTKIYKLFRKLKKRGPLHFKEVVNSLPPMQREISKSESR